METDGDIDMRKNTQIVTLGLGALCGGCGHMPDISLGYFLSQSKVSFKIVRSVACDNKDIPIVATAVTPFVTHGADIAERRTVNLSQLRGVFSDTDVKFELHEDGRLKSINATTQGQGESILKSVATLTGTLVAFAGTPQKFPTECAFIKAHGGGKPLTLTYEGTVDTTKSTSQTIETDAASLVYADHLKGAIGEICAKVENISQTESPVTVVKDADLMLKLRQPAQIRMVVRASGRSGCQTALLWSGTIPVAQAGRTYELPISKPSAFSKQVFALTLSESGSIASVQYSSTVGTAQAANGINTILTAAQGDTTTEKVAQLKMEADLIFQQQRLVQCLADPKTCK